jgi:hypothetical protein
MLIDTTPLAHVAGADILAEHKLVRWPDGSSAALHQVRHPEHMDGSHLALQIAGPRGAWFVFPVAAVCPPLAEDLRTHHWHDWPGLVYYQLRTHFDGADHLHSAVLDWQAREAVRAMRRAA